MSFSTIFSHFFIHGNHAFAKPGFAHSLSVTVTVCGEVVSRTGCVSSRRQERRWATVCGSPQLQSTDWRRRDNPISSSLFSHDPPLCAVGTTVPVLSRSSRQRRGHLHSHFDRGWHVCQAVIPELQCAAARRRVERHDCVHETLPRLQSAGSWSVMEQLVSGACRVHSMRQATVLLMCGGAICRYRPVGAHCPSSGTFAHMPHGWISHFKKIPRPSIFHMTYLPRYSRRWYSQKKYFPTGSFFSSKLICKLQNTGFFWKKYKCVKTQICVKSSKKTISVNQI